jgi:hypothetical protein
MRPEDFLAVAPSEAAIVVVAALALAIGVMWLLITVGSTKLPDVKKLAEVTVKIPGFNITLKGAGLLVLFIGLFVSIVGLYLLLRIVPGAS